MPKPVKQKVSVAGCAYELHDIYGISATAGDEKTADEDLDDGDSLCVICLSGASLCSPLHLLTYYPLLWAFHSFGLFMFHSLLLLSTPFPVSISDERTTAVLPCRLCLCADCAQSLRTKQQMSYMHGPVQSLLHIKVEE